MSLPQKINAMRVVTYDVNEEMIEDILESNNLSSKEEITTEHLIEHVGDWAIDDLSSTYNGTIFQDQNGNNLQVWES